MPPRLTYILLTQNHGSKDNKDCTCTFNDYGRLIEASPACPVQGHRYFRQTLFSRFRRNAFSKATPHPGLDVVSDRYICNGTDQV